MATRKKKLMYMPAVPSPWNTGWRHAKGLSAYDGEYVRFTVHGRAVAPGKWFVYSPSLHVDGHELLAADLGEATREALTYLEERLRAYAADIAAALNTLKEKKDAEA